MRVVQPGRDNDWYHNGITYIAGGIGPHALTQRASYTVASGKRVRVEGATIAVAQNSMPTAGGLIQAYITDGTRDVLALLFTDLTTMDQPAPVAVGFSGYAGSGDGFLIYTADASAGSSVSYRISLRLMLIAV